MHTLTSAVANLELPPPRKSTYTRAMLINLILLRDHMSADNCVWKMFAQDPCQFNEDVGETAMAILARVSEVKPCKGQKLELSNKIFRRLKLLSAIPTQFTEVTTDERERLYELSHQCPEVTQSIAFLKRFVGSASINGLTEYHKTSFEKEADAVTSSHDVVFMARFKAMDVTSQLTSDCPHFIRQLSRDFFKTLKPMMAGLTTVLLLPSPVILKIRRVTTTKMMMATDMVTFQLKTTQSQILSPV